MTSNDNESIIPLLGSQTIHLLYHQNEVIHAYSNINDAKLHIYSELEKTMDITKFQAYRIVSVQLN